MNKYILLGTNSIIALLILLISSCKTSSYANYDYKSKCLGSELDGSQTIKAWGKGSSRKDAVEQAKKNAVRDVVFKGIQDDLQGCKLKPILLEINAEEKYQTYFNTFFTDGGEFTKFVSLKDERISNQIIREKVSGKDYSVYSVVVRVKNEDLKNKLIKDQILK
jgi:endonuclease I